MGRSYIDNSLPEIKKSDMAKRGKGEYIVAGVLHNFSNATIFIQLILIQF